MENRRSRRTGAVTQPPHVFVVHEHDQHKEKDENVYCHKLTRKHHQERISKFSLESTSINLAPRKPKICHQRSRSICSVFDMVPEAHTLASPSSSNKCESLSKVLPWQKSQRKYSLQHPPSMGDTRNRTEGPSAHLTPARREDKEIYDQMLLFIRNDECKSLGSYLKKKNIDLNVVLRNEGSLLHEASYKGCIKCIKCLLKSGSYVNLTDDFGYTSLHAAVLGRNHQAVKLLLANNALPNQMNGDRLSPCHLGVMADDVGIMNKLIEANGDPLIDGGAGSAFQMAIDLKKFEVLAYFINMPSLLAT